MQIPEKVKEQASVVGGYSGINHLFLTDDGEKVVRMPFNGWLVCGNYYGSAIFRIDQGLVKRVYGD